MCLFVDCWWLLRWIFVVCLMGLVDGSGLVGLMSVVLCWIVLLDVGWVVVLGICLSYAWVFVVCLFVCCLWVCLYLFWV